MDAKKEADEHAATAPQKFREEEQKNLTAAQGAAGAATAANISKMHQSRAAALGHVGTHKDAAKAKNEAARAKVAAELESIYNATKKEVDDILGGLDAKVGTVFDRGEKSAREAFENDYETKRSAYFKKRYKGLRGKGRWLRDKFKGAPPEVNEFIVQAKQLYITKMEAVINDVANIVEAELNRATVRIAEGRKQITDYVNKQPKDLKKIASEAAKDISGKFEALDQAVTDKASDIVDDLADKYNAAAKEVDDRCDAMREENKGLIDKAKDKIKGMIEAIGKVKDMLSQMADKAAGVIGDIIAHPIRFLGNLIGALKQGFGQFVDNIGKHLAEGLMGWLLGELGAAGIQLPETFDVKGILHFVAQILGLTWENIRARAVEMLGPEVVAMIEQGVGMFQKIAHIFTTLREQGLAGLWDMISDKIGDLKAQVMDQIQDFVITKVITAGVKWILGLLNPVGAFIKACLAIYDIVMFFINHGSEILALVNAILDNLAAIVAGNIGAAANLVEKVMAKAIPLVIGFLASLLGVGGIGEKIKSVINAVRKPINKAMDWVLKTVVKPVAKAAARAVGFVKGKVKAAGNWMKRKGQAGIDFLKKKSSAATEGIRGKFGRKSDERTPDQKLADLQAGLGEAEGLLERPDASPTSIKPELDGIRKKYRMASLRLVIDEKKDGQETVHVEGVVNPKGVSKKALISLLPKRLLAKLKSMGLSNSAIASVVAKSPDVNHVSGELFEQLGYLAGRQLAAAMKIHFFAGNRFSSVRGRQFTDGVLGIRRGKYLQVREILEAKAGPLAASKLATEEARSLTDKDREERIQYAVDQFKEDNPRWRKLTVDEVYARFPRQIDARADKLPTEETGQGRRDVERGAPEEGRISSTWLLDGEPIRLVVSPMMTRIHALLPADVSGAGEAAVVKADGINFAISHLSITSTELVTLASKIVAAAK
jgi:hypothetical protein